MDEWVYLLVVILLGPELETVRYQYEFDTRQLCVKAGMVIRSAPVPPGMIPIGTRCIQVPAPILADEPRA